MRQVGNPIWAPRVVAVLTVLAIAACAPKHPQDVSGSDLPPPEGTGINATALAGWKTFPVTRKPRPVVLVGDRIKFEGFATTSARMAALAGFFLPSHALPTEPKSAMATLPDGSFRMPILTGDEALAVLRLQGQPPPEVSLLPVLLADAVLDATEFQTDRGKVKLPAWKFTSPDATGPIWVLALRPEDIREYQASRGGSYSVFNRISRDGLRLTVELNAPVTPCPGERIFAAEAQVVESATAVGVGVLYRPTSATAAGPRDDKCETTSEKEYATYTITLAAPLGNRVVVDRRGAPISVTPLLS